ncbi:hypothetical protein ACGF07_08010 [Kitasatospora sp. NPDC048194]|uniref:hypothetical protein n=1 Tax=Kitasatospora sp. NPDC048194 TaxID=3364045 RepID=UPI0037172609
MRKSNTPPVTARIPRRVTPGGKGNALHRAMRIVVVGTVLIVAAAPLVMLALSRLPAERAFQKCAEQPDVSQCHDPLTSWLP